MVEKYGEELLDTKLFVEAEAAGLEKELAAKLFLILHYWDINIPTAIKAQIKEKTAANTIQLFKTFLSQPKGNPPYYSREYNYGQTIKQIKGFHRKVIFIVGDIFPSLSFMKKRYKTRSRLMALLHYPHRLGKFIYLIRSLFKNIEK